MAGWLSRSATAATRHRRVVIPKMGKRPKVMPSAMLSATFSGVCPVRSSATRRAARAWTYPIRGDGGSTSSIWVMESGRGRHGDYTRLFAPALRLNPAERVPAGMRREEDFDEALGGCRNGRGGSRGRGAGHGQRKSPGG